MAKPPKKKAAAKARKSAKPAPPKRKAKAAKPKAPPKRGPGTGAPLGNKFWLARASHGRDLIFASADKLWEACVEYFEWAHDNPLQEDKLITYRGETSREHLNKMRAMTIEGLCIFLDIDPATWALYREREGFIGIVSRVETVIRTQKFEGASAGFLNPSIIARDLGLAEKLAGGGKDGAFVVSWLDDKDTSRPDAKPAG